MSNHAFYTDTAAREPNRLLLCILLALLVHAGLLAVLPLLARGTPPVVVPSVDIQIQAEPIPPAPAPPPVAQTTPPPPPVQVQAPPPPAVAKPAATPRAAPKPSTDQAARAQPGAAPAPGARAQPQAKVAQPRAPAPHHRAVKDVQEHKVWTRENAAKTMRRSPRPERTLFRLTMYRRSGPSQAF